MDPTFQFRASLHLLLYPLTTSTMKDYLLMFGIFAFLLIFTMLYPKNTLTQPTSQPTEVTFQKGQRVVCSIDNENPPQTGTVLEDN